MNEAHFHLIVNHLPIIFTLVGIIIMTTGLLCKSTHVKRTAYLIFIIGGLTAIAAVYTGEGAEEMVGGINSGSVRYIEAHEEAAGLFAILTYVLGGISVVGLWISFKLKKFLTLISVITLLFAFAVLYFGTVAGTTGGEIRHREIRSEFNPDTPPSLRITGGLKISPFKTSRL